MRGGQSRLHSLGAIAIGTALLNVFCAGAAAAQTVWSTTTSPNTSGSPLPATGGIQSVDRLGAGAGVAASPSRPEGHQASVATQGAGRVDVTVTPVQHYRTSRGVQDAVAESPSSTSDAPANDSATAGQPAAPAKPSAALVGTTSLTTTEPSPGDQVAVTPGAAVPPPSTHRRGRQPTVIVSPTGVTRRGIPPATARTQRPAPNQVDGNPDGSHRVGSHPVAPDPVPGNSIAAQPVATRHDGAAPTTKPVPSQRGESGPVGAGLLAAAPATTGPATAAAPAATQSAAAPQPVGTGATHVPTASVATEPVATGVTNTPSLPRQPAPPSEPPRIPGVAPVAAAFAAIALAIALALALATPSRRAGATIGGSVYTDRLENDREFGQTELSGAGVNTLSSWNFTSFDEAVEFVEKNPDRYVIKPSGNAQNEKELLYVGQEEDGKDVEQVLVHYKMKWSNKIKVFQIQRYETGVEVGIGAFFNGYDFVYPININFEHKRLFPKNIGPSTGEMGSSMYWTKSSPLFESTLLKAKERLAESRYVGYIDLNCIANARGIFPLEWTCFDLETEILTGEGWKGYADVSVGDEALSINPETKELAWKTVTGKIVKNHKGRMIRIGAKSKSHTALDALVTPDHNLLIEYSGRIKFARADAIPIHETKVVRTGLFKGKTIESIEVPEYVETHYLGRHKTAMQILHPAIKVEAHHFMSFLGLYLAEGSMGDHILSISQSPANAKRAQIQKVLDSTGLKYTVQKNGAYQFSSKQLCKFFEKLGLSHVLAGRKFLPKEFKELSPDLLESFLHGYALGDGNRHTTRGNQLTFGTSSKRLADDVQELLIKCGKVANIRVQKLKGTTSIGGYTRNEDMYVVSVREKKMDYSLDKRAISEESYEGLVWDVEVDGWHTMLVRRRGKPFFSGNCRFGYPTISIQMEGVTSEWGALLWATSPRGRTPSSRRRRATRSEWWWPSLRSPSRTTRRSGSTRRTPRFSSGSPTLTVST